MYTINLKILLVTFTIKVVTHHTRKNNIALSLARRIVRIVTDNTNNRLQELKGHLLKRKHPEKIIDYSFTKLFQPRKHENNDKNVITSLEVTILIIHFLLTNLKIALKTLQIENFKTHSMIKKYSLLHDNIRNQGIC